MSRSVDSAYEVLRIPSLVESGYEVVDTATMSLSQRMIACLDNDKMCDVHLVGDDGIKVNACKFILGSTSSELQTLLYSGKDKKPVFSFPNCRAKTLKALVEFSCCDMLNTAIWADTEPVEIVEDMIALAKLSEQYALPNLKQQVSDVLSPCLEQLPSLACVAFNLADTKTTPKLHSAALDVLRNKPYQAFVKGPGGEIGGIACLGPEKLDTIFRDPEVNAEEIFLFQCLQEWRTVNVKKYANCDHICRMVAQNLDYSAIHASDIEDIVLPSGIVDSSSVVTGLMTLAKAAEKKGITLRSSRRKFKRHGAHGTSSDSNIGRSGGRTGRRFKKAETAKRAPSSEADTELQHVADETGSYADDTSIEASLPAEKRDPNAPAPVAVIQAPRITFKGKHNKTGFRSRATKFLGSISAMKNNMTSVKEDLRESDSADITVSDNTPKKTPVALGGVKAVEEVKDVPITESMTLPTSPKNAAEEEEIKAAVSAE